MGETTVSVLETRRHQMFPQLDEHDIARLKRFGEICHFPDGTLIMKATANAPNISISVAVGSADKSAPGPCR